MAEIQGLVQNIMTESETVLNRALDNPYINTGIKVFLGLYAAFAAPQLPKSLANLMDHVLVRIGFAFVIVFMATRDPSIAILVAIAFIVTLQTANKFRLYDTSLSKAAPGELSWLPSVSGAGQVADAQDAQDAPATSNMDQVVQPQVNVQEESAAETQSRDDVAIGRLSEPTEAIKNVVEGLVGGVVPASVQNATPTVESEEGLPGAFTTDVQFAAAQSNRVPGANQMSCVKTWNNQHCIQGLQDNSPNGNGNAGFSSF